mmetsp:Transcript_1956/g.3412  ORF Transcript_1956/g.3412 Transcript_1956/m.3412 type:complete len:110 (+) Transcript_1956:205-534(+)
MPKRIKEGSEWYVISMKWIERWQRYTGFGNLDQDEDGDNSAPPQHPGPIDNSDIISFYTLEDGSKADSSVLMKEMSATLKFTNYQLKPKLKEGEDFMLVDKKVYEFWGT